MFVRTEDGAIQHVARKQLDLDEALERGTVAPLREGDEVLLESAAGRLRGRLGADPDGEHLSLELSHGQELKVERSKLQAIQLLYRTDELVGGVRFMVKSKSGNSYEGTVGQVLPDRRALVKLMNGRTVDLRLDRLQLDSLVLSIPVPVSEKAAELATRELEVVEEAALARAPSNRVEEELERERRSARLLRKQLQEVLAERERLETDMKQRERALESEVWRGMATNRDLSNAKKRLRELEAEIQRRAAEQED
ncbi:MAG: hypothetical protein R3F62_08480 [Planctomycetota bacterium]